MNILLKMLLTLVVGGSFGVIFRRLKVPNGFRIGALFGSALLGIFFGAAWMPAQTRFAVQVLAGAFIGCTIEKSDVKQLPRVIKPTLIMLGTFLVLNLGAGALIHTVSPLDWVTALMSAVPGGITDTPIIAEDMGADVPKVAIAQLARYFLGVGAFPPMIVAADKFMEKRAKKRKIKTGTAAPDGRDTTRAAAAEAKKAPPHGALVPLCTLAAGTVGGLLGNISGIPAGTFLCSTVAVLVLKLSFNFAFLPRWIKEIALLVSGCYIGSLMTMNEVRSFAQLAVPVLVILCAYIANCFITGTILSRTCGFSRKAGMLCTTPAGASDIALSAAELGVQDTDIILIQVFRAIIAIGIFPQIINALVMALG